MKIIVTLAAVLTFGIASAQTDPKQVPQTTPPATPKTEIKDKPIDESQIQTDAVNKHNQPEGEIQPRKDELKTQDHVKSTPHPSTVKDTVRTTKKARKAKRS